MMLRIIAVLLLVWAAWGTARASERAAQTLPTDGKARVALVIGNGTYTYASRLDNPKRDSSDIAALLRRLNFDVVEGNDLTLEGMVEQIEKFAQKAETAKIALFYYAGHGIQVDGRNYLLSVDAKLEKKTLLRYQAIDLDAVTNVMIGDGRIAIALLDACRDNPLTRSYQTALGSSRSVSVRSGLAYPDAKGDGLLIGYATSPGETAEDGSGRNSPYASALLKYLDEPNVQIEQTLKKVARDVVGSTKGLQRPWYNSNLNDDFVMNDGVKPGENTPTEKNEEGEVIRKSTKRLDVAAIPAFLKKKIEDQLPETKIVGMELADLSNNKFGERGYLVSKVDPGSWAAKGGIAAGDFIKAFCEYYNYTFTDLSELHRCVRETLADGRDHVDVILRKAGDTTVEPQRWGLPKGYIWLEIN